MPDNTKPNPAPTAWDGFGATLIHDVGKVGELTTFAERSRRKGHELSHAKDLPVMLDECFEEHSIPGSPCIPAAWYDFIEPAGGEATGTIQLAHKLADRISKQIQGAYYNRLEDDKWLAELEKTDKAAREKLRRHNLPTHFYPFFGGPKEWQAQDADPAFHTICSELGNGVTLPRLLRIQELLKHFPHTRYIPHLSLQLHDLFAASLFYFIYCVLRDVEEPEKLTEFAFYTFEVSPDLLDVFYRLRDVLACTTQAKEFYKHAFTQLFAPWERDLPSITPEHNPFVFYASQGFVFLYPDFQAARSALDESLRAVPLLRRVEIRCARFAVGLTYRDRHWDLGPARTESTVESLPAPSLADFAPEAGERCEGCQRILPAGQLAEDDKGSLLCESCRTFRRESTGIDLDAVSRAGKTSDRVAYVFVTLPPDLRRHAAEVADTRLIPDFWSAHSLPTDYQLPATEQHVYEYLQALLAVREFDAALEEGVQVIRLENGQNAAHTLFQNPSSKAIVVHEDYFWDLVEFVHHQKQKLRLECSVRAVICPPKTPFWSLVELATEHQPADILWDVSKGAIHMFSDPEITSIRQLARDAQKYHIWRAQLNALSAVALQTSLEELILEIDNRADRLKELRDPIKNAVRALGSEGSSLKDQEKRAVFFKYIAGLTR